MAEPLSASKLVEILRKEGLTVHEVRSWRTHNRNSKGAWGPVNGVMIHHTVTKGTDNTVAICYDGYSGLPGPLCHGVIDKQGHVHLVGNGRANHAGLGDGDVLQAVINETSLPSDNEADTDGNRHFYGFECENLGDGADPWPAVQKLAIEKVSAAICRHHGWGAGSVIGHLEWQPGKSDPRGFTMQDMRGRIAARLGGNQQQEDDMALSADDLEKVRKTVWESDKAAAPDDAPDRATNPTWQYQSFLKDTNARVRALEKKLATLTATNDKLVGAVATLAANIGDLDPAAIVAELRAELENITIHLDVPDA
ncbi:N-acetylmuramoyl-L-alanine amidase [Streptomyces chartreusis]|uniref:N-acetylmuramoyl-L-alanine amidase n=1 Tax=Streptomyces chartreusis TaxID=1969 RepID=UPI0019930F01|nr:N-acetylmuramoyl-L-alanine amidase [Streptomyces chartreusis]GGW98549.1 hypothetical protein GCM10010321_11130 [Streptomyces chartreusis]